MSQYPIVTALIFLLTIKVWNLCKGAERGAAARDEEDVFAADGDGAAGQGGPAARLRRGQRTLGHDRLAGAPALRQGGCLVIRIRGGPTPILKESQFRIIGSANL